MSRHERKASTIKVNVLDLSKLEQDAFEHLKKKGEDRATGCKATEKLGFVETPVGIYALSEEGIGLSEPVSGESPLQIEFRRTLPGGYDMFPCLGHSLNAEDVLEVPVKEVVTLDKFIRSFGSRLEVNYEEWEAFLTREMKKPKKGGAREVAAAKKEDEAFKKSPLAELIES